MSCRSEPSMVPLGMPETTGRIAFRSDPDDYLAPGRIVVLAHADDPRQWQCSLAEMQDCSRTLVADDSPGRMVGSAAPGDPELWDFGIAASFVAAALVDEAWLLRGPDPIGDDGVAALGALPLTTITGSPQFKMRASETLDQDALAIYERI